MAFYLIKSPSPFDIITHTCHSRVSPYWMM